MNLMTSNSLLFTVALVLVSLVGIYMLKKRDLELVESQLTLVSLGWFTYKGKKYNLHDYYVDRQGKLYSRNGSTWEVNPNKDKDILICSDNSKSSSGKIHNTLRTAYGTKLTIRRDEMKYYDLLNKNEVVELVVKKTTPRHLKVLAATKVGM